MRILPCLFFACCLLRADPLSDLKSTLTRLDGRDPVKARVDCQSWVLEGDEKIPEGDGDKAAAWVEDTPEGLRISWDRGLIEKGAEEGRLQMQEPDRKTPVRRAMDALGATRLNGYFNAAPELLAKLEQVQLIEEKADTWEGHPVRRLTLKVNPRLNERSRRVIKEIDATAKIWIAADGVPVAAEYRVRLKGRVLLVITFESTETEEFRFGRTGNRLVVLRHVRETKGSGGGESNHQKTIANLTLADG